MCECPWYSRHRDIQIITTMADSRPDSFSANNVESQPSAPVQSRTGLRRKSLFVATHRHLPRGINPAGESHRRGFHPWMFLKICFRSSSIITTFVNILWPFVPAAIVLFFTRPDLEVAKFSLNYIAMIPTANLIGFAGQQLAQKLPKVLGMLQRIRNSHTVRSDISRCFAGNFHGLYS